MAFEQALRQASVSTVLGPDVVVLERLSASREVFRIFDPAGGRDMRRLTALPAGRAAWGLCFSGVAIPARPPQVEGRS